MKNLVEIEIHFENTEIMSFTRFEIGDFFIGDIKPEVCRVASNFIGKMEVAHTIIIELFSEADVPYNCIGTQSEDTTKFERILRYDDIVSITCCWNDNTSDTFFVNYNEGENEGAIGADNIHQISRTSLLGNLYLTISDSITNKESGYKFLNKTFPVETYENVDAMEFRKDMMFRIEQKLEGKS